MLKNVKTRDAEKVDQNKRKNALDGLEKWDDFR